MEESVKNFNKIQTNVEQCCEHLRLRKPIIICHGQAGVVVDGDGDEDTVD